MQDSPQHASSPASGTPARAAAHHAPPSPHPGLATPQHKDGGGAKPAGGGEVPAEGTPASPVYSLGTPSWRPAGAAGLLGGFTPSLSDEEGRSCSWDTGAAGGNPSLPGLAEVSGGPQVSSESKPAFAAWSAAEAEARQRGGGMHK